MRQPRVLVTGAAGKTGRAVLAALARRGAVTRALVRRDEQRTTALEWGATEVAVGDMRERAVVKNAARGASAVYHIAPNLCPDEVEIAETLISAARATGVWRVVHHSVLRPQIEAMPHHWAKLRAEEALLSSGLDVTVLQPGPYTQNLLGDLGAVARTGELRVPYSVDVEFALVDLWDVAAVAARCLTEPHRPAETDRLGADARAALVTLDDQGGDDEHSFAVYELAGPANVSVRQVAVVLGAALGRTVTAVPVPLSRWRADARASGMDERSLAMAEAMFDYYDAHGLRGNGRMLRHLLRRPGTDISGCVRREVRTGLGRRCDAAAVTPFGGAADSAS